MWRVRTANSSDYAAFVELFPELGTGDPVPSREVWERKGMPNTAVIEERGSAYGYIYYQVLEGIGYVRHVVVTASRRGAGHGRRLLEHVARNLRAGGCTEWCLNVKPDNVPAVRLYTRMGMRQVYESTALRMPWVIRERLPAAPTHILVEPLEGHHDADCEATFGLPRGLLAEERTRAGSYFFRALSGGSIQGLAMFRPAFPGAFPFRARSVEVARALLDAMAPHADPDRDWLQLVFEDAPDLTAAFTNAGARVHLEFAHFHGPIPAAFE